MARDIIPIRSVVRPDFDNIKKDIFRGESGGDYDALWNYQNRPGGDFENIKITDMTVDEALHFSSSAGSNYGNYVRSSLNKIKPESGRYATPMGAFQVVGSTLKMAKKGLGLSGGEKMTPALQDLIGKYIYDVQGTDAWAGYRGPRYGPKKDRNMMQPDPPPAEKPGIMGLISKGLQNKDLMNRLALGFNTMRLNPDPNLAAGIRESMADRREMAATASGANRTVAMLRNMKGPDGKPIPSALQAADLIEGGGPPGAILQSFYQSQNKASTGLANRDYPNGLSVVTQNDGTKKYMKNGVVLTDPAEIEAAVQDTIRYDSELAGSNRGAVLNQDRASEMLVSIRKMRTGLSNIERAITAINNGAVNDLFTRYMPNITQASAELSNAMDTMGLDVIGSVTFGALSEGEMRLAMDTAVPRNLSTDQLKEWLITKRDAQEKAIQAISNAARYFAKPGNTLEKYLENQDQSGSTVLPPTEKSAPVTDSPFANMNFEQLQKYISDNAATMSLAEVGRAKARLQELQGPQQ